MLHYVQIMLHYVQIMLQYVQIGVLKNIHKFCLLGSLQREHFCQNFP